MSIEQKHHSSEPPIVEPKEFLSKPFERLNVGELRKAPNINFLKWLPKIPNETGLVYQDPRWFVIKASELGVPKWIMPENSDILLHSHPHDKNAEAIPSMRDFLNSSPYAKTFSVSKKGITEYKAINHSAKEYLQRQIVRGKTFSEHKIQDYLDFLGEILARFKVYPWKELDNKRLAILFQTKKIAS
jgi:hypothetical protein